LFEFCLLGVGHRGQVPESRKEFLGIDMRDSRHTRERGFGGRKAGRPLWALGVSRPVTGEQLGPSEGEAMQPESRVSWTRRSENSHVEVHERDTYPADRSRREWAVIEIGPFNKEVSETRRMAKSTELRQQVPSEIPA